MSPPFFLHNGQEKGPGGARNTALDRATGDFVFFLDADDVWDPDHLRRAVGVYQGNPQVDCISIAGLSFGQSVRHVRMTIPDLPQGIIPRHSVAWNPIGGPTGFSYRRSAKTAAVRFKDALYFADIIFYLELLHLGATFWRENSVRYWYRRSPGQLISIARSTRSALRKRASIRRSPHGRIPACLRAKPGSPRCRSGASAPTGNGGRPTATRCFSPPSPRAGQPRRSCGRWRT
ncbi:glycosyltransferase family 2 protein [Novosphingobium sp. ST904]|uniref:glycosyltransferase family 2 protein n=1 Tax=Novosphingobium sp. ST904 TaxID=1684385 RepID=UPI0006C86939|nr:glycosyltransferase family 2 protein [Novosphingobium sp. ST904]KPH66578.1 hypothetical protein ADT71_05240 [Novosphingobium sp. ST904]